VSSFREVQKKGGRSSRKKNGQKASCLGTGYKDLLGKESIVAFNKLDLAESRGGPLFQGGREKKNGKKKKKTVSDRKKSCRLHLVPGLTLERGGGPDYPINDYGIG